MFTAAFFTTATVGTQPGSIDAGTDKEAGVSISGISVFITKKEILPFVTTQMNLEHVLLHEISQTQEDILDDMTHM